MTTETIPRALLGQLTNNPQVISYLEQLGVDAQAAPLALEQVQSVAMDATSLAASAGVSAMRAEQIAEQLSAELVSVSTLRSQIARLTRRIEELEALAIGTRL